MDRVTSGESSADFVQLAVAAFLIAKLLAPFRGGILAGKHGGSAKIRPGLYQVVQDLNSILGIPANGKVINKQQLKPSIVLQPFPVSFQAVPLAEDQQLIQQIAVINIHAAVVHTAGLPAEGGHEIGFSSSGDAVDTHIQTILGESEGTQLLNHILVVTPGAAGYQLLHLCVLVNESAEPQVGYVTPVHAFDILRLNHFPEELLRRIIAQLRTAQDLRQALCCQRQIQLIQHGGEICIAVIHLESPSSWRLRRFCREYLSSSSL